MALATAAMALLPGLIAAAAAAQMTATAGQVQASGEGQVPAQATDPELHLLRRTTFGVRPADLAELKSLGIEVWLDRQLNPSRIDDGQLDDRLDRFPAARKSISELVADYSPPPQPRDSASRATMTPAQRRMRAESSPARILADMTGAKLTRAAWSERQLEEVMTDFWFNHFNVYFGKGLDRYLVSDYERTAIRPHVFGRFEDMLLATAKHPAMLFYLDNWTSFAPDSMSGARDLGASRQRRQRGMNENYARELLELHTLGVDGGYTQDDVVAVARAFTGWTFVPPANRQNARPMGRRPGAGEPGTFSFRLEQHDTEKKIVLGRELPAGRGMEDGTDVIRMVASHPSTARHIATKLIERFVSDSPDPAFVDELAAVFTKTDGDLREVTRALFVSPRFYDASNVGTKVKTPFELVASALRVTYADIALSPRLMTTLRELGQLPYDETSPTGYPSASEEWVNSGAMLNRMNFALELTSGRFPGVRPDGQRLARDPDADPDMAVSDLIDLLTPGLRTDALVSTIQADLTAQTDAAASPVRSLGARAVGLALGSPAFQRR
jgi:uncharacterized protein (DUF1800 family)